MENGIATLPRGILPGRQGVDQSAIDIMWGQTAWHVFMPRPLRALLKGAIGQLACRSGGAVSFRVLPLRASGQVRTLLMTTSWFREVQHSRDIDGFAILLHAS